MLKREDFVGTMIESSGSDGRSLTYLITGVAGEGETAVAFVVSDIKKPSADKWVLKFLKPVAWLEMTVLHGMFRINEELYPNHPQRMPPERRLQLLKQEMIGRVTTPGTTYRVHRLLGIYNQTIDVLARYFYEPYFSGDLADDFLDSNPAIKNFVDPLTCQRIDFYVKEDLFVEKYADFFQFIKEYIEERLLPSTGQLPYKTASTSALVLLWGLRAEGFFTGDEFYAVLEDAEFQTLIVNEDLWVLFQLISVLYFQMRSKADSEANQEDEKLESESENSDYEAEDLKKACDLLIRVSTTGALRDDELAGLGNLWMAYAISLSDPENAPEECLPLLYRAIPLFEKSNSLANLHDVFLEIATLLHAKDKAAADSYMQQAEQLREKLQGEENEPA